MVDLHSLRLHSLPRTVKVVISLTLILLGIGYLLAMVNLYLTYAMTDGEPGLSANDLKRAFYGNRDNTRLAAKIHGGSMEQFLPRPGDKEKILSWIQDGAQEPGYAAVVQPILRQNCIRCHDAGMVADFRPLTSYLRVMEVTEIDRGEPIGLWARVAHTHIQSIALILLVLGLVFSMTTLPEGLKLTVSALPFVSLIADFAARALAKFNQDWVYVVMGTGALVGACCAIMIAVPLYEMAFKRAK